MLKHSVILTVLLILILSGCSSSQPIQDKPDLNPPQDNSETIGKPPTLGVSSSEATYQTTLGAYCWDEGEDSCTTELNDPEKLLEGRTALDVKQEERITLYASIPPSMNLPQPDNYTLKQIRMTKESNPEVTGDQFIAPTEKGKYYYSVTAHWEGEIKGEAVYAFALYVQ